MLVELQRNWSHSHIAGGSTGRCHRSGKAFGSSLKAEHGTAFSSSDCAPGQGSQRHKDAGLSRHLRLSDYSSFAYNSPRLEATQETRGWEGPLEEGRQPAPVFLLESPMAEEPGGPQSMGLQRGRHD